jgi:hypothetical protein
VEIRRVALSGVGFGGMRRHPRGAPAHAAATHHQGFVIAYSEWLKRYKVDDMDKSGRAKLLQLMEERPAVEE